MMQTGQNKCEQSNPIDNIEDTNLPAVMASLEMLTVDTGMTTSSSNKRILRKRPSKPFETEILNRRCSLKPKKRQHSDMENEDIIKEYYLDKHVKKQPHNLETIFEEKDESSENVGYMGNKRHRRLIQFRDHPTDSKIKKRRAKIKKIFGSKNNLKRRRVTMQLLLDKLNGIRAESPAKINADNK